MKSNIYKIKDIIQLASKMDELEILNIPYLVLCLTNAQSQTKNINKQANKFMKECANNFINDKEIIFYVYDVMEEDIINYSDDFTLISKNIDDYPVIHLIQIDNKNAQNYYNVNNSTHHKDIINNINLLLLEYKGKKEQEYNEEIKKEKDRMENIKREKIKILQQEAEKYYKIFALELLEKKKN